MYNDGWESIFAAVVIIMTFTAGTALIMWLGEQINQKGVGNGISILLFAGIVSRMPALVATLWQYIDMAIKLPAVAWIYYIYVPVL